MKIILFFSFIINLVSQVSIVASTSNLASIAKAIGKENVSIVVIVKQTQNPHSIQVLPSYMLKIARADLYLQVGLRLDFWSFQLIDGARNSDLIVLDCSRGVSVLEKPTSKIDPSKGHIHPEGNPHYDLNPANAAIVANNIKNELIKIDPEHKGDFEKNYLEFIQQLEQLPIQDGEHIRKVLSYHSTWAYLADYLNLNIVDKIEPLPGIEPTASHLNKLIQIIKGTDIKFIIQEDFYNSNAAQFLKNETGIKLLILSPFAKDVSETSYFTHINNLIKVIEEYK